MGQQLVPEMYMQVHTTQGQGFPRLWLRDSGELFLKCRCQSVKAMALVQVVAKRELEVTRYALLRLLTRVPSGSRGATRG
jgi:hypothetical protein